MSGHSSAGRSHCQNCGEPLSGPFCAKCGQHDIDYHRSLGPIIEDSLEGFLHFDGKFFKSVRWLFTRPGFLTREFIAGKRVAYIHPLRLYIFASFLYFASSLFLTQPPARVDVAQAGVENAPAATDRRDTVTPPETGPSNNSKLGRLVNRLKNEDHDEVGKEMRHLIPTMAFFCLPFLASVLLLAYAKSGRVYVEHLIFALHIQAFYFLAALATGIVQTLLRPLSVSLAGLTEVAAFLAGAFLVYRAFRVVYGEGRWRTVFKLGLVGLLYGIVLIVGVTLTAITASLLVLSGTPVVH